MTKSNIIVLTGLVSVLAISVAANLKLKSLHKEGKIYNGYITKMLPSFKAIRIMSDGGNIEIYQSDSNAAKIFESDTTAVICEVKNDTLYISRRSESEMDEFTRYTGYSTLSIAAATVQSVRAEARSISLRGIQADSLYITASNNSELEVSGPRSSFVQMNVLDSSTVRLQRVSSVPYASISIPHKGTFQAFDVMFENKQLQLSNTANLQLSGRSLTSFGLLSSQ